MPALAAPLTLLLAPVNALSGDGQLRELMAERRSHLGGDGGLWFLPAPLVRELTLAAPGQEAVAARDPQVITWLQLRFGGQVQATTVTAAQLQERAAALPPRAREAAVV